MKQRKQVIKNRNKFKHKKNNNNFLKYCIYYIIFCLLFICFIALKQTFDKFDYGK